MVLDHMDKETLEEEDLVLTELVAGEKYDWSTHCKMQI